MPVRLRDGLKSRTPAAPRAAGEGATRQGLLVTADGDGKRAAGPGGGSAVSHEAGQSLTPYPAVALLGIDPREPKAVSPRTLTRKRLQRLYPFIHNCQDCSSS